MALITADIIIYYVHLFSKKGHRASAGILEQSMGARNRVGIGLKSIPGLPESLRFPYLYTFVREY